MNPEWPIQILHESKGGNDHTHNSFTTDVSCWKISVLLTKTTYLLKTLNKSGKSEIKKNRKKKHTTISLQIYVLLLLKEILHFNTKRVISMSLLA